MTTKKIFPLLILALFPLIMGSCGGSDDTLIGEWKKRSTSDASVRSGASSFTIGNKGYMLCGQNNKPGALTDCWVYDMVSDSWEAIADFPGEPRAFGVAFALNNKGYYGTGYVELKEELKYYNDFWEYNPATNVWTQIADFPGTARRGALAFALSGKGYVGCGWDSDNYLKDFYSYSPGSGWEKNTGYPGQKRENGTAFVIGNTAYVCCGMNSGALVDDFHKFDGTNWTALRDIANNSSDDYDDDYTNIVGYCRLAIVIDGAAYLNVGYSSGLTKYNWKYYPETDLWEQVRNFKYTSRIYGIAFTNGSRGYIGTGQQSATTSCMDDLYEFIHNVYDDDDTY